MTTSNLLNVPGINDLTLEPHASSVSSGEELDIERLKSTIKVQKKQLENMEELEMQIRELKERIKDQETEID